MTDELLIIEIGKKYLLRNGLKTQILKVANNGTNYKFEAEVKEECHKTNSIFAWKHNGKFVTDDINHKFDIIKEL